MKLIDAAEGAYSTANSYFLLLWGIVAVVGLTAFFEAREIDKDLKAAVRDIALYEDLLAPADAAATALTQGIAASPYSGDPKTFFTELRRNAVRARPLLTEIQTRVAERWDLSIDHRLRMNQAINDLRALLLFNVPTLPDADLPRKEDEAGLTLAATQMGTLGYADTVTELRIEDAARILWLATLPVRDMIERQEDLRRLAASTVEADTEALIATLEDFAEATAPNRSRDPARNLWNAWLRKLPLRSEDPAEQLARIGWGQLQLFQPEALTEDAIRARALAEARRSGSDVEVSLPGFSLPIRLSDALIFLPAVAAFCLISIYAYTSRGLRYGTAENLARDPNHQIVGRTPVYLALYGVSKPVGWAIAALALSLPIVIAVCLALFLIPSALHDAWARSLFWFGLGLDAILLFAILLQAARVTELIDEGYMSEE